MKGSVEMGGQEFCFLVVNKIIQGKKGFVRFGLRSEIILIVFQNGFVYREVRQGFEFPNCG